MTKRVAVVTGAGSGIGRATALSLLNDGWQVALAGRNIDKLASTAVDHRDTSIIVGADITLPQDVEALFERTVSAFGRIDLLFNNAGTFVGSGPIEELRYGDWRTSLETNLHGAFLCAQSAYRLMKQQTPQGGRIINNGSVSAHAPRPNAAAYTVAKHAITGLTKAIALEGRRWNIACSQIDIGNASTDMTKDFATGMLQANGCYEREPLMDVDHVASTFLHMANLPLEANVQFVTIMATSMPLIGRG